MPRSMEVKYQIRCTVFALSMSFRIAGTRFVRARLKLSILLEKVAETDAEKDGQCSNQRSSNASQMLNSLPSGNTALHHTIES